MESEGMRSGDSRQLRSTRPRWRRRTHVFLSIGPTTTGTYDLDGNQTQRTSSAGVFGFRINNINWVENGVIMGAQLKRVQ